MTDPNVRLQNLRDFTVQIRRLSDDAIIGTGIVVSMDGKVVTCTHVVAMAGVDPREPDDGEVGIYFPQIRSGEEKQRRATVAGSFPHHDDDVVLLQLTDGPTPLGPEQIAVLGTPAFSHGNSFRSYGYRRLDDYTAGWADGRIQGSVDCPEGRNLQAEPIQLESSQINRGMSGAAILDVERNLVVAIVSETWFPPEGSLKDRDTAWAVNAHILTLDPLNLPVREAALPRRAVVQLRTDLEEAEAAVSPKERIAWNNAPPPLEEWVGREDLLRALSADWADPDRLVTGLIGFGGEGKSSLARRWVEELLADFSQPQPDSVFWWGFYTKPSVDEFFEAALNYLAGGSIDPHQYPSPRAQSHLIAAMLHTGRFLFILDGLEILQHQGGDQFGLLQSTGMREFLSYFAAPGHQSFCLITNRAPVFDLMEYTTYTQRDVTRLTLTDGRALLREVGVKGLDAALDRVVDEWGGHALTLSLLAGYTAEYHEGNVSHIDRIPPPAGNEPRYERVHRILNWYDDHLTEAERVFLAIFSAFRTPVEESAFGQVFRADLGPGALDAPLASLDDASFDKLVQRLAVCRILTYDLRSHCYTAHPLIHNHYSARLMEHALPQIRATHLQITKHFWVLARDLPYYPSLEDLNPLIEVVYHACRATAYDEAFQILWETVYQERRRVLVHKLGRWETALALLIEFFPDHDTTQEPWIGKYPAMGWLLNETGQCLTMLGRLDEASSLYRRSTEFAEDIEDWWNASRGWINLAELFLHLGRLSASSSAAQRALNLDLRMGDGGQMCNSLAWVAWLSHQCGDLENASTTFNEAEKLAKDVEWDISYLYDGRGIFHAEHLRRIGRDSYAKDITQANLSIARQNRWSDVMSQCYRILGDLDARLRGCENAYSYYDRALVIAQETARRDVLIEALLAKGRCAARDVQYREVAFGTLREALDYCVQGGYRIYEADTRTALAWVQLAEGKIVAASAEALRARHMSEQMGYYWGQVDADEVLAALDAAGNGGPAND